MAASDLPDEAVEAGLREIQAPYVRRVDLAEGSTLGELVARMLAAAVPHLRAQVLAEVDAALRDETRYRQWWVSHPDKVGGRTRNIIADYLADTLGAGGDNAETKPSTGDSNE